MGTINRKIDPHSNRTHHKRQNFIYNLLRNNSRMNKVL